MSEWQLTKKPPSDDAPVLVASIIDGAYDGFPVTARFNRGQWVVEWDLSTWRAKEFTHWQPLPK